MHDSRCTGQKENSPTIICLRKKSEFRNQVRKMVRGGKNENIVIQFQTHFPILKIKDIVIYGKKMFL